MTERRLLMADKDCVLRLSHQEHGIIVNALYDKHNQLVEQQGPFEAVDQVLVKVLKVKVRRKRADEKQIER